MMPQRAVELAQQAVKNDPQNTTVLDTLAWAYLRNGQHHKALRVFEQVFLIPVKTEEDPKAQESSWEGMTELVQAEIDPRRSQEFDKAFLNFYRRLSRQFAEHPTVKAKLEAVFHLFQSHRKG
jgi:tetratricopeptide (TPR) repeat protein